MVDGNYSVASNVMVPMRDGVRLAVDLYRPDADGPVPVLLVRNPYDKFDVFAWSTQSTNWLEFVRDGYAVVIQDTRGLFASEGEFVPHVDDEADAEDTLSWILEQAWCDGNVGMFGVSYLGVTQWQAAVSGVGGLKAIAPSMASADLYRAPWYGPGGALSVEALLGWSAKIGTQLITSRSDARPEDAADFVQLAAILNDVAGAASVTPLAEQPLLGRLIPWVIDQVVDHPDNDESWQSISLFERLGGLATPALITAGWYDGFVGESLRTFVAVKDNADARLVVGPWSHSNLTGRNADRKFGIAATYPIQEATTMHKAFFDRHLRGETDALAGVPKVRLFVMGIDEWRDETDWPLPDTAYTPFYLGGSGAANTSTGGGTLSTSISGTESADTYLYDPADPVPSLGGTLLFHNGDNGPADQRPIHDRDDVLCYSTEVLTDPVEVTGTVSARLFVSSSAVDTDFTAKLVDVFPDGRAIALCDGIVRMRYRETLVNPTLIEAGEIYEVAIDMLATSNVFLPGHRIMVQVSSSNFPKYDRNSNTGGVIAREQLEEMCTAVNRIHRGPEHPSHIVLPIIKRKLAAALEHHHHHH
uniref:Cocaine esterase n=1 Tax=Rhodococcus sp. MB1 TaxID=51612 RepID=UPI0001C59209|nr:Chain A, Cocaine esterase [Rhodococcus sp. MB1]